MTLDRRGDGDGIHQAESDVRRGRAEPWVLSELWPPTLQISMVAARSGNPASAVRAWVARAPEQASSLASRTTLRWNVLDAAGRAPCVSLSASAHRSKPSEQPSSGAPDRTSMQLVAAQADRRPGARQGKPFRRFDGSRPPGVHMYVRESSASHPVGRHRAALGGIGRLQQSSRRASETPYLGSRCELMLMHAA